MAHPEPAGNLWLAQVMWDLGCIRFGDFTVGTTVDSPVYVNPRLLVSRPDVMRRIANIIDEETTSGQVRRKPRVSRFDVVAGVPLGGLHLAGAYSIVHGVPLIYPRFDGRSSESHFIEGGFSEGQRVLIIDDLVTGGRSLMQTADLLREAGLEVSDALVLIDRGQNPHERLRHHGINLVSILPLKVMLNYLHSSAQIHKADYERAIAYLDRG
jgi:orotate phosphoribosyltransferase/uridine monophosphate synthetase